MKLILLLVTLLLPGCANTSLTEQEIYERAERKETMHDEIRARRNWCQNTPGMIEVYTGHASSADRRRMQRDVNYIPRHASKMDFQCASAREVQRALSEIMP